TIGTVETMGILTPVQDKKDRNRMPIWQVKGHKEEKKIYVIIGCHVLASFTFNFEAPAFILVNLHRSRAKISQTKAMASSINNIVYDTIVANHNIYLKPREKEEGTTEHY
ncbi:hypothetical protein ACJX0J_028295, partial [Zea mays]